MGPERKNGGFIVNRMEAQISVDRDYQGNAEKLATE